jgi:predicted RNase H-like HicB family nuclease
VERTMTYTVHVGYDEADNTYFVLSSDIPGLHAETRSFEALVEITQDALPDLVGEQAAGSRIIFQREVAYAG